MGAFGGDSLRQQILLELGAQGLEIPGLAADSFDNLVDKLAEVNAKFAKGDATSAEYVASMSRIAKEAGSLSKAIDAMGLAMVARNDEAMRSFVGLNAVIQSGLNLQTKATKDQERNNRAAAASREALAKQQEDEEMAALRAHLGGMEQRDRADRASSALASENSRKRGEYEQKVFLEQKKAADAGAKAQHDAMMATMTTVDDLKSKAIAAAQAIADANAKQVVGSIDEVIKAHDDLEQAGTKSDSALEASAKRLADSRMKIKDVFVEHADTLAKIAPLQQKSADADARAEASSEGYEKAIRRAEQAVAAYGAESDEARKATTNLERVLASYKSDVMASVEANDELKASMDRLMELQRRMNGATSEGAAKQQNWARMLMFSAQGIEDLQYGFNAVVNNIPLVTNELGKILELGPELSMTFSGIASIGGVALNQIIKHWDGIRDAMSKLLTGEFTIANVLTAPINLASSAIETMTEKMAITFPNKAAKGIDLVKKELKDAEKVTEELGSKTRLTTREMEAYDKAKEKVKGLKEQLQELKDLEDLMSDKSEEEGKVASGFSKAFAENKSTAKSELTRAMAGQADAKGNVFSETFGESGTVEKMVLKLLSAAKQGNAEARDEIVKLIRADTGGENTKFTRDVRKFSPEQDARADAAEKAIKEDEKKNKEADAAQKKIDDEHDHEETRRVQARLAAEEKAKKAEETELKKAGATFKAAQDKADREIDQTATKYGGKKGGLNDQFAFEIEDRLGQGEDANAVAEDIAKRMAPTLKDMPRLGGKGTLGPDDAKRVADKIARNAVTKVLGPLAQGAFNTGDVTMGARDLANDQEQGAEEGAAKDEAKGQRKETQRQKAIRQRQEANFKNQMMGEFMNQGADPQAAMQMATMAFRGVQQGHGLQLSMMNAMEKFMASQQQMMNNVGGMHRRIGSIHNQVDDQRFSNLDTGPIF